MQTDSFDSGGNQKETEFWNHSVQDIWSSCLLSKSMSQNIQYHNFACDSVLVETWSLILKDEQRLRVYDNRVLRRILGPRMCEVTKKSEKAT
jgi:hypothetical protein